MDESMEWLHKADAKVKDNRDYRKDELDGWIDIISDTESYTVKQSSMYSKFLQNERHYHPKVYIVCNDVSMKVT